MSFLCCGSKTDEHVDNGERQMQEFNKRSEQPKLKRGGAASSRRSMYFDASQGQLAVLEADNDLYFFDAQSEEEETETSEDDPYVAITTNYVKPSPRRMSILEPESMLSSRVLATASADLSDDENESKTTATTTTGPTLSKSLPTITHETPPRTKKPPQRSASMMARHSLENPSVKLVERGYPGELTPEEVAECQRFYREIKKRQGGAAHEIVYSCSDVEQEPYTLCRFVRATKFDADKMLERLDDPAFIERWRVAKEADFYPDLEEALHVPVPTLLSQYHFLYSGNAKNGCPVSYMKANTINTEGLLCLLTVEDTKKFFWHSFVHIFKPLLHKALKQDSNFVRCEAVAVLDLKGASSSQLNADATEVIKHMTGIADYFPETLHCMVIVNAASWFSLAWRIIKRFIDPRTARKIEVYSNADKGEKRLLELIDAHQLPSNFGGSGPSTYDEIQQQGRSASDMTVREIVKLIHLKRGSDVGRVELQLEPDEIMSIKVYTRSVSSASFSVTSHHGQQSIVQGKVIEKAKLLGSSPPHPSCTELASSVRSTVTVEASHMEEQPKGSQKKTPPVSVGYFLVVASVEKAAQ